MEKMMDWLGKGHFSSHLSATFNQVTARKTTRITAAIFISLLITLSSMPGVHAVSSQSPGSGNQAIASQASEPETKVSAHR